jgi:CII-binding regulator of phage lambda lysogenization HflD
MNNELTFSEKELEEKNRSLNSKKAPDVYGITAEHLKYGGSTLVNYLTKLLNNICKADSTLDLIKLGILSSVFKRKEGVVSLLRQLFHASLYAWYVSELLLG